MRTKAGANETAGDTLIFSGSPALSDNEQAIRIPQRTARLIAAPLLSADW
jgi:hypothetical protein